MSQGLRLRLWQITQQLIYAAAQKLQIYFHEVRAQQIRQLGEEFRR
jgi:hypothetical protein